MKKIGLTPCVKCPQKKLDGLLLSDLGKSLVLYRTLSI